MPKSVINAPSNKEYIDPNEFEEILKEAEEKLKMDKDKKKSFRDYVFEIIPVRIKNEMYPHERFEAANLMLELTEKQPELMIKLLTKEIELNKKNPHAYFERGVVYGRRCLSSITPDEEACNNAIKDFKEALKYVKTNEEKSITGVPFRMSAYERLGTMYRHLYYLNHRLNDLKMALYYYTKSIELDPLKPSCIHFYRGMVNIEMGDYENAIRDLNTYKNCVGNGPQEKRSYICSLCFNLYQKFKKDYIPECPSKEEIRKELNVVSDF